MTKELPQMLEGPSEDILKETFIVGENLNPQDGSILITAEDVNVKFSGGNRLAHSWIGWGIIRKIVSEGKQAVLLYNPKNKVNYPK